MEARRRGVRPARVRPVVPGLALATAIAGGATVVTLPLPATVAPALVAVTAGLLVANLAGPPPALRPGARFAATRVLRMGVVLLGARLTFGDVAAVGGRALAVTLVTMTTAFLVVAAASRRGGVPTTLATLLGVGTAVCGNSAIMATAPVIRAPDRDVGVAVATITLFGTLALLTFPVIGHLTALPDRAVGFWIGLAVHDTSQVMAAAAAYSQEALDVAVVVKLVRNALMAPLILLIAWTARRTAGEADHAGVARTAVPLFVVGFLVLAGLRSVGLVGDDLAAVLGRLAAFLITVAIAGVGLQIRVDELRRVGARAVVVGFVASAALTVVAFVAAGWLATG